MGVCRKDYVVYGWKLPYDEDVDYYSEELSIFEDAPEGHLNLIVDGMCGNYVVFGILVYELKEEEEWEFVSLDVTADPSQMKNEFAKLFKFSPQEPSLFIFSHFH